MTRVAKSHIEEAFALHCAAYRIEMVREFIFHPKRKWRFDFALPEQRIAIECEGGLWTGGRHTRGSGAIGDMQKYNEAARLGWKVFRFDGNAVASGEAIQYLRDVLKEAA